MEHTEASPTAVGETEIIEGPDAKTAQAWSEAVDPPLQSRLRRLTWEIARFAIPAVLTALAVGLLVGGHEQRVAAVQPPRPAMPAIDPAPGPAPDRDDNYLRLIAEGGWIVNDRPEAIAYAHWVCTYLGNGHSEPEVVRYIDDTDNRKGRIAADEIHKTNQVLADSAIRVYCPTRV